MFTCVELVAPVFVLAVFVVLVEYVVVCVDELVIGAFSEVLVAPIVVSK